MKLKFNPEAHVTEWMHGTRYLKNEGDAIEVPIREARAMLNHMHEVSPRQFVNIFVVEGDQDKPKTKAAAAELSADYPADFPHADVLVKAGYSFEAVRVLTKENLVKLEGIGPKSADAIIAAAKGE